MDKKPNTPIELANGGSALAVWLELHSTARFWKGTYSGLATGSGDERRTFGRSLEHQRDVAANLRDFPAERWRLICEGQGWTPIGCCVWSWCEGADLSAVIDLARRLDWTPAPDPAAEFAALLIDPALLPPNRLSDIFRTGRDEFGSCLLIAARNEPPEIDLPPDKRPLVPLSIEGMMKLRHDGQARDR